MFRLSSDLAFFAVMTPPELTVATVLLEPLHVTEPPSVASEYPFAPKNPRSMVSPGLSFTVVIVLLDEVPSFTVPELIGMGVGVGARSLVLAL